MYRFQSFGEVPMSACGSWFTAMIGVSPEEQREALLHNPGAVSFDLFIMNRRPMAGLYIDGFSLNEAVGLIHFLKNTPDVLCHLHSEFVGRGIDKPRLSKTELLDSITEIDISRPETDFILLPSFEPFICPRYVSSNDEYYKHQAKSRLRPFYVLYASLGMKARSHIELTDTWTTRNGAMNRLARPMVGVTDSSYFEPMYYCPAVDDKHERVADSHYWEWLEVGDRSNRRTFVRAAYIVDGNPDNHDILTREQGPEEHKCITPLLCPHHYQRHERSVDGFITRQIPVTKKKGIHARPSSKIALSASRTEARITLCKMEDPDETVDAGEPLGILSLCAEQGSNLLVSFSDEIPRHTMDAIYLSMYHAATTELD